MRLTTPSTAVGAVLLAVSVAACTGSGSSFPKTFTPSAPSTGVTSQGTRTPSPTGGGSSAAASGGASATPRKSATPKVSATPKASASDKPSGQASSTPGVKKSPTHHVSPPASVPASPPQFPGPAPETGGGGTAGLQDGLLFGGGGAAVLVGLGTLAYRRRLARKFAAPDSSDQPEREPADR
jgi:hypothetical protein